MAAESETKEKKRGAPPPEEMKQLPRRLKEEFLRKKKKDGLTQQAIADATGLSQGLISDLMAEPLTEGMTVAALALICKEMNVSLDYIVMGVGDEAPKLHRSQPPRPLPPAERSLRESETPPAMFPPEAKPPPPAAPGKESSRNKAR